MRSEQISVVYWAFPHENGCFANHLPVRNVKDINDYMTELGYDVVLAGKGHIQPNSVFNWTRYFSTNSDRLIPINKVEDYITSTSKPVCIIFLLTSHMDHTQNQVITTINL